MDAADPSGQASQGHGRTIEAVRHLSWPEILGDWTDRIAKGELPRRRPPRPQAWSAMSSSRVWDWSGPKTYLHDEVPPDKAQSTVNA